MGLHNRSILAINRRIAESLEYRGRVLDLGCGSAPYRDFILRTADEYIGVDWEHGHHAQAHVDVFADLTQPLPFESSSADMAVAFQVLEHLPEPRRFLEECHRILRPGGEIVLTTPFMWEVHEAPYDFFRYTRYGLEYMLRAAGFEAIDVRATTGFWQTAALKFNYHTARRSLGPLRYLFMPIWVLDQAIAPMLDRLSPDPGETASYVTVAKKPG